MTGEEKVRLYLKTIPGSVSMRLMEKRAVQEKMILLMGRKSGLRDSEKEAKRGSLGEKFRVDSGY